MIDPILDDIVKRVNEGKKPNNPEIWFLLPGGLITGTIASLDEYRKAFLASVIITFQDSKETKKLSSSEIDQIMAGDTIVGPVEGIIYMVEVKIFIGTAIHKFPTARVVREYISAWDQASALVGNP